MADAPSNPPFSRDDTLRLLLSRRSALIAYLYSYVRDLHIAEDLFQEVALRAVEKHATLKDGDAAFAWLRAIARNIAIDWLRRDERRPISLNADTLELLDQQWQAAGDHESSDLQEALSACMAQLTPRARQLIEQRYKNQMTTQDIAEAAGRKVASVYTAFSRIYLALGDCIKNRLNAGGLSDA